jgi:hypothetical protein
MKNFHDQEVREAAKIFHSISGHDTNEDVPNLSHTTLPTNVSVLETAPVTRRIDPAQAAEKVAFALEANNIPYAVGGALASDCWMPPVSTYDADFNVFVKKSEVMDVIKVLADLGVEFVLDDLAAFPTQDFLRCYLDGAKLELFFNVIPFMEQARKRRKIVPLNGDSHLWVNSAEVMIVFKLLFHRMKDLGDVERIIFCQQGRLDYDWINKTLIEMVGEDSEIVATFNAMVEIYRERAEAAC